MKNILIYIAIFLIRLLLSRFSIAYISLDFGLIFKEAIDRHLFIGVWFIVWHIWWLLWVLFYNEYNLLT